MGTVKGFRCAKCGAEHPADRRTFACDGCGIVLEVRMDLSGVAGCGRRGGAPVVRREVASGDAT